MIFFQISKLLSTPRTAGRQQGLRVSLAALFWK